MKDHSNRKWLVNFELIYDDGTHRWTQYYRTRFGAQVSAFWKYHIGSWGGTAKLHKRGYLE